MKNTTDIKNTILENSSNEPFRLLLGFNTNIPFFYSLKSQHHLLIVGASHSKKEQAIDSILLSLLYQNGVNMCRLILYDNQSYFAPYMGIPHLLTDIISDNSKTVSALRWLVGEVDSRYKSFAKQKIRNIDEYNHLNPNDIIPRIVFIINPVIEVLQYAPVDSYELLYNLVTRGANAGVHLIITTDRVHYKTMPKSITLNIPARLVFQTIDKKESQLAGVEGAEKLPVGSNCIYRVIPDKQIGIETITVSADEIKMAVNELQSTYPVSDDQPSFTEYYADNGEKDPLFNQAVEVANQFGKVSASLIQRRLSIGYARAAKILDQLETAGFIAPAEGSKPREVIKNKKKRILLIENDEYMRELFVEVLKEGGYDAESAIDGAKGLEKIKHGTYDLILLSIMLPIINGIDVLGILETDNIKHGKIVVWTNNVDNGVINESFSRGVNGFMWKSEFTPDQFLDTVNKYITNQITPEQSRKKILDSFNKKYPSDTESKLNNNAVSHIGFSDDLRQSDVLKNKKKSILVIDDDKNIRELYEELFKEDGYIVETAIDGADGLEKIKHGIYDLILLNIMMPKLTGIDVLKKLYADNIQHGKIVICTIMLDVELINESFSLGAIGYLCTAKMTLDDVLKMVNKFIANQITPDDAKTMILGELNKENHKGIQDQKVKKTD